jgi:phosphate transport system permease protein
MDLYTKRLLTNKVGLILSMVAMVLGLGILFWILSSLVVKGIDGISIAVFTEMTPPPGESGGLLNAIFGSLLMVSVAIFIAIPIGVMAGIYLAEYGQKGWVTPVTRFVNDILLSAPSIVLGLFIYAIYVANVKHFSGWAGAFALTLIAIPVIVRSTDNMLLLVPNSLREAAAALGAPKWKIIFMVTLRAAKAGVTTGVLLAIARISGETAPLLFTALNNQFWTSDLDSPMANLPVVIFQFAMSPFEDWKSLAWVGALLITFAVLFLSIIARSMTSKKQI